MKNQIQKEKYSEKQYENEQEYFKLKGLNPEDFKRYAIVIASISFGFLVLYEGFYCFTHRSWLVGEGRNRFRL